MVKDHKKYGVFFSEPFPYGFGSERAPLGTPAHKFIRAWRALGKTRLKAADLLLSL